MDNKTILESLSMDLLRVALGLHRGSYKMAERFSQEALKRTSEVQESLISPYAQTLLIKIQKTLVSKDQEKKSEDALMYSTLIRNCVLKNLYNNSYLKEPDK